MDILDNFPIEDKALILQMIKKAKAKRKRVCFDIFDKAPPLTDPTTQLPNNQRWKEMAARAWKRIPFKRCTNCSEAQLHRFVDKPNIIWCYYCGDMRYDNQTLLKNLRKRSSTTKTIPVPARLRRD